MGTRPCCHSLSGVRYRVLGRLEKTSLQVHTHTHTHTHTHIHTYTHTHTQTHKHTQTHTHTHTHTQTHHTHTHTHTGAVVVCFVAAARTSTALYNTSNSLTRYEFARSVSTSLTVTSEPGTLEKFHPCSLE